MSERIISIEDIKKIYVMGTEKVHALDGVSLDIHKNEYIALMGPSGSGKSTLMNLLGLLDTPSSGSYLLKDQVVSCSHQQLSLSFYFSDLQKGYHWG